MGKQDARAGVTVLAPGPRTVRGYEIDERSGLAIIPIEPEQPSRRRLRIPRLRARGEGRQLPGISRVPIVGRFGRSAPLVVTAARRITSRLPQLRGSRSEATLEEARPRITAPEPDERDHMPKTDRASASKASPKPKKLRKQLREAEDRLAKATRKRDRAQAKVEALSIITDEIRAQLSDAEKAKAAAKSPASAKRAPARATTTRRRTTAAKKPATPRRTTQRSSSTKASS